MKVDMKGKRIMYKFRMLVIGLATILLVGCSAGAPSSEQMQTAPPEDLPYEIICDNGNYYLLLEDSIARENVDEDSLSAERPHIEFASMDEMLKDIKTGDFTESELKELSQFKTDDDGRTSICDISKLYDAYTPERYDVKRIDWFGYDYSFAFREEDGDSRCSMSVNALEIDNEEAFAERIDDCTSDPNFQLISVERVEDRNATVTTYMSGGTGKVEERKIVYYTIKESNKELYVHEEYLFSSDSTPFAITIFGTENGIDFTVFLSFVQERPSVEYLLGFGFREYVETEVA